MKRLCASDNVNAASHLVATDTTLLILMMISLAVMTMILHSMSTIVTSLQFAITGQ